jgi:hypothetical protein
MGEVVINARVARMLAAVYYDAGYEFSPSPSQAARQAATALPLDYPGFLRFALHSLAVYLDIGYSSSQWLAGVLDAAHYGSSFRRCFFFAYKADSVPYPRVTNRGVQGPKSGRKSQLRKAKNVV